MSLIRKHSRLIITVAFVLLFIIGLLTVADYGLYFDQQSEALILRENQKEYAVYLQGPTSNAVLYYNAIGIPRITKTAEIDHGIAAFYPLAPFMARMDNDQASLFPLWNGLAWCWFMAGVCALYALCRKLGMGRLAAFAGAMLLYLSPRFFAEGHYNNKDMVLMALSLLCMYSGVRLWEKPTLLRGIPFALAGALCANTKIIGVCIFGVMGLAAVVLLTAQRRWKWQSILSAIGTLLAFGLFYALLTPAMWEDPAHYFRYLITNATGFTRWDNHILFRGVMFQHSTVPLPFYYLPYMMIVTLPVYTLALCGLGQLTAIRYCWQQRKEIFSNPIAMLLICATLIWAAPLGYAMLSNPVVYNGWRHFYFTFAGLAVLGAWGLECLISFFAKHCKRWQQIAATAMAALCLLTSAAGIALNHPHQYAYYNALGRWLCPTSMEEGMELDYWCVSIIGALEDAVETLEPEDKLTYSARDPLTQLALSYYNDALPETLQGKLKLMDDGYNESDLLVINPMYYEMYGTHIPQGYEPLLDVHSYGNAILTIYRKIPQAEQPQGE